MSAPAAAGAARGVRRPGRSRRTAESALLGLVVGLAVVAPWTAGGYLLLLDWVSGPHQAVTPGLYGLDAAALDAMPYRLVTQAVRHLVGARATGWLAVACYFPIAAGGVSALVGGGRWRRNAAASLMVCNPFIVERIRAGHVSFLLSVALLTWLFASALHAARIGKPFAARPAGWYALSMAVAPHGAWLGAAGLVAVALLPRPRPVDLLRTCLIVLSAAGVYLYGLVVLLTGVRTSWVSGRDLAAYAPQAGRGGLLVTVASLHGFWRGGVQLPSNLLAGAAGPAALAVLLATVVTGLVLLCRREPRLGAPVAAVTVLGLLLGAGVHGPIGPCYAWMFRYLPLFEAMREQQKWVALAMIGYAVAVGAAAEALADAIAGRRPVPEAIAGRWPVPGSLAARRWLPVVVRRGAQVWAGAIACCYLAVLPTLLVGLGGSVGTSRYPAAWASADRIMGGGQGMVLFLPWHAYQPFAFTGQRTVATPAAAYFRRPVLSSDAVELGDLRTSSVSRRSAYLDRVIAAGGGGRFGRLVAPLGVEYVVLARDREAAAYAWLDRQTDLRAVLHTDQLDVYRVLATGTGRVESARYATVAEALRLAAAGSLGTEAVLPDEPAAEGPGTGGSAGRGGDASAGPGGAGAGALPAAGSGSLWRTGSTSWRVGAGAPGWVVLPEEWAPGWRVAGRSGRPTTAGTVALQVGAGAVTVEYQPWRWLRAGIGVSLLTLVGLLVAGVVEHRGEWSGWLPSWLPGWVPRRLRAGGGGLLRRLRRAWRAVTRRRSPG